MVDDFVHDESQKLLAEGRIQASAVCEFTKPGDLHRLAIWVGWGKTDGRLVFSDPFGDLEALGEHVDECCIDVVDAVSAVSEYLIVVHLTIVSSARREIPLFAMTNLTDHGTLAKIITVSDGVVYGTREDRSGAVLEEHLGQLGYDVVERAVTEDGTEAVRETLERVAAGFHGVIVTTGGTGFGPRDLTPEGTRLAIDREAPGLAEAMRLVNPLGRLSRGVCGTIGDALVLNTPGSTKGCVETFDAVADVVPHAVRLMVDNKDPHPHAEVPSDVSHQHESQ